MKYNFKKFGTSSFTMEEAEKNGLVKMDTRQKTILSKIEVDFFDEDIKLQGETFIKGGEAEAENYVHIFEEDLRYNFADLFPKPEPEGDMME